MAKIIVMPKLGLTMEEGTISRWIKTEGENIEAGEALLEVSTDKLVNEIESSESGVVRKILFPEGENVKCLEPIAIIAALDEDISNLLEKTGTTGEVEVEKEVDAQIKSVRVEGEVPGRIKAAPIAKKLAEEKGINLELVTGTGHNGRIVLKDVEDYIEENKTKISPTAAKMAKDLNVNVNDIDSKGRIMKEDILKTLGTNEETSLIKTPELDEIVIPSMMRKIIAARMLESCSISPMVTFNMEIDTSALKEFREKLKESFKTANAKLTYNHLLMKIAAKTLKEFPYMNASFDGKEIILHKSVNIGLAISIEGGLMVPNIKNVQDKSLLDIALETEEMIIKTKENKLLPDDAVRGTFTISNIGMFGVDTFSPIINQPELAILGVNAIVDRVVAVNGEIVIRPMMNLSLTVDHRVIDGAMAAQFLKRFRDIAENPLLLLM